MSNPSGKIHKPTSRITLSDLFGPGPLPTPDEISAAARNEQQALKGKAAKSALRAKAKGLKPGQASTDHAQRLEEIRRAASTVGSTHSGNHLWFPTARLLVVELTTCLGCGHVHESPGATTWLVQYTNKRTGATQAAPAGGPTGGPIDMRLPGKKFIHESEVHVCTRCATLRPAQTPNPKGAEPLCLPAPQESN